MEHKYKIIYDKLVYVHEHSGDGATIHETGHLSGLIFNYAGLIEKETANPIMGVGTLDYYKSRLEYHSEKAEKFLTELALRSTT